MCDRATLAANHPDHAAGGEDPHRQRGWLWHHLQLAANFTAGEDRVVNVHVGLAGFEPGDQAGVVWIEGKVAPTQEPSPAAKGTTTGPLTPASP